MKKLSLLAIGAAALAVAGFSSAASAHDRGGVSFGIFLGGPVVEERGYDREDAYWAHRRWVEHERWEAYQRARAEERYEHERARAYDGAPGWHRAYWYRDND